jgi:3-mercaptopyruvate sulfurtransferase SseA
MGHRNHEFIRSMLKIGKYIMVGFFLIILLHGSTIGRPIAQNDNGVFCCNCELTWLNEHNNDINTYNKLYDQYCDKNGDPKINAGNTGSSSLTTKTSNTKSESYPNSGLLVSNVSSLSGSTILDVREQSEYIEAHISGARNIYWKSLQPRGMLEPDIVTTELRNAGINNSDRVIIYGGTDSGPFYVFWALSYLSHTNLSIIDGGLEAIAKTGASMDQSVPKLNKSNYTIHINSSLSVSNGNIDTWINRSSIQILDARSFTDYGKAKLTESAIPLDATLLFDMDSTIWNASKLKEIFNRRLDRNKIQLVYGTPQAYSLFYALELMGYNATILEGSWWKETKWAVNIIR